jgi:hypothetical protein
VVAALKEAERAEAARSQLEDDFEAAVERRVQQETSSLRSELEAEYEEQIADAEESSAARKKREKADKRRAAESAKRLARAQEAEDEVDALRAQIDKLHEQLQGMAMRREARDADSDDDEAASKGVEAGRSAGGRFTTFDWRTRRLFHGWLARRIPPASAGRSYAE